MQFIGSVGHYFTPGGGGVPKVYSRKDPMALKSPPLIPFPRFPHSHSNSPQICPDPKLPVAIVSRLTRQLIAFSFLQSTQLIKFPFPGSWQLPRPNCFTNWVVSLPLPLFLLTLDSHSFPLTHSSWLSLSAQMIPTSVPVSGSGIGHH